MAFCADAAGAVVSSVYPCDLTVFLISFDPANSVPLSVRTLYSIRSMQCESQSY